MNWIRQLLSRRHLERDLHEEIRQHLEQKIEELIAAGMSPSDAAFLARREFGNVTLMEEKSRNVWHWVWIEDFLSDLRHAFRQLKRSPGFAVAGTITLALGIGANTAVFSVVNAVVLRPLPFPQSESLVSVCPRGERGPRGPYHVSYPNFFDLRAENRSLDRLACYRQVNFSLTGLAQPVEVRGEVVSWDLFQLLGVQPVLGRSFNASEEDAGVRAVILSYGLWKSTLGGDPALVGGTIRLDREPYAVVGIAPEGFNFPLDGPPVRLWTPLAIDARSATVQPVTRQRGARMLSLVGRLKPGLSIEQAQADLDRVAASLAERFPGENKAAPLAYVEPHQSELTGSIRRPLWILLGAVGLVLLVACANMANLILSRTAGREHEFAIRAAIGAGRARILRQVLTESLALSLLGSAVGVFAAHFALQLLEPLAGAIPRIEQSSIDQRVLLFSILLAIGVSIGSSLAPALRVGHSDYVDSLRKGARGIVAGSDRLRSALVVCQIALGLVLVSAAGLLASSFLRMMSRDPGFQPEHLLTFWVHLPDSEYPRPRQLAFYSQLIENLDATPGIVSAAIAMPLPLSGNQMRVSFDIEQSPSPPYARPSSDMAIVSPGFFQSLRIPLIQGRRFLPTDDAGAPPVLIVNKAFADKFFPGQDPVGKRIEPGATSGPGGSRMREIVGVVGNARQAPLNPAPQPIYYFPYQQLPWCCPSVIARSDGSPANLESTIRAAVASLDRMLPVSDVRTPAEVLSLGTTPPLLLTSLMSFFAALALILTAVGLYGLLHYAVTQRTREISVRIALGAGRPAILSMVLRKALLLTCLGVAAGMAGVLVAGKILEKLLYEVGPRDPALLSLAVAIVLLSAGAAAALPAWRASVIDPMEALRAE